MTTVLQPGMTLAEVEKIYILTQLRYCRGNLSQTARVLDISPKTLDNKLKQYEKEAIEQEKFLEEKRRKDADFQRRARGLPPTGEAVSVAQKGLRMESFDETPAQHAVSLPIGKEVQGLPPKQAGSDRSRKSS